MTLTFENDNDVIVYALESIISYARQHQYIFVAQSVWWIAAITGLTEGLVTHIDNLQILLEVQRTASEAEPVPAEKRLSSASLDNYNINKPGSCIHPERKPQIDSTVKESYEVVSSEPNSERATSIIQSARKFVGQSKKARKALKQNSCLLSRTRSGKIPVKPLTQKQRNRLQAISKDTLVAYMKGRE